MRSGPRRAFGHVMAFAVVLIMVISTGSAPIAIGSLRTWNEALSQVPAHADARPSGQESGDNPAPASGDPSPNEPMSSTAANDAHLSKIEPSLREKLGGKGYSKVFIATTDVAAVAEALDGYSYEGLIGKNARSTDTIEVPLLDVPLEALPGIASLSSVISIFEYSQPVKHSYEPGTDVEPESSFGDGSSPLNLNSTANHRANIAWANNFTGNGTRVAVIDDGIDFAHPDLMGTQARADAIYGDVGAVLINSTSGGETAAFLGCPKNGIAG